jgi:putative membrane protein
MNKFQIFCRGFAMGMADIIPGVSGGTIAFITGIYTQLIDSLANLNTTFFKLLLSFKIKDALAHINGEFLIPLFVGIGSAIILTSHSIHYLLNNHAQQTWSLFFGLIAASIFFIGKSVKGIFKSFPLFSLILGTIVGYSLVTLIPTQTPDGLWFIFISAIIAITAMILPGLSGAFLLVIMGKYHFVTSALRNPSNLDNLLIIITFCFGALTGLILFSKVLKVCLTKYNAITLAFLTGIMAGSMKKVWPWRKVLSETLVDQKRVILEESLILPADLSLGNSLSIALIVLGFVIVYLLERKAHPKN